MGKYAEDARELLGLVGGKENIAAVSHCMTRMRFALVDPSRADIQKIEAMKVVKGSFTQSGQFQVIIGNTVSEFYQDFVKTAGIEGVSRDAVKQAAKKNQNVLQRIATALAEIFAPLIPAIITGGLILGFRNCIDSLYLFEQGTKTLCDISQFWAGISCYLGVTEPAIFGVNLKQGYPFVCGMIGSALAAIVCVATSTTANAIGVGGLPGILSIQPEYMGSFALCMLIAVAVPLCLTVMVGKKRLLSAGVPAEKSAGSADGTGVAEERKDSRVSQADAGRAAEREEGKAGDGKKKELKACLTGKVIPLKEVNDGVFSEGIMGDGIAILPENGTLVAPADAEIAALMEDSKHACGLRMADGMEILLHIGLDTVNMKGDGFSYMVKQGQKVKAGDPLIRFDRKKIQEAGYRDVTVCIISAPGEAKNLQFITGIQAKAGETAVVTFE